MTDAFDVLAARVDALSRHVRTLADAVNTARTTADAAHRTLDDLTDRVTAAENLATEAARQLLHHHTRTAASGGDHGVASWLADPQPDDLARLCRWIDQVLIHYPDTAHVLTECWPYHPAIVEELLALHAAWTESYCSERASGIKAADWHDRHRPAALGRVYSVLRDCSIDAHEPGKRADHTRIHTQPGKDHIERAAAWWITGRDQRSGEPVGGQA